MCGIVGTARVGGVVDEGLLVRMRDTMIHRGPDDAGVWVAGDGRVGLAQRRLAIIDLSPGGHQPMADPATGCVVTFNGEIYNYRELRKQLEDLGETFRTRSDTEVLLACYRHWGTSCLERLNGMFAFGLYDPRTRVVLLARDRAGEKPLFYRASGDTIAFASELKALFEDPSEPRRLDPEALGFFLTYGYVPGERCLVAGVRKLPQGHALAFELGSGATRVWPYWELPEPQPSEKSPEELEHDLEALLQDSVRLRLVADVPVGILLSGGVDSGLVTAMAARVAVGPVKTFTVSFPDQPTFDEAPRARLVAAHFGTVHSELVAEAPTLDLLPRLAAHYDEPIGDASMLPTYLVSRLIRQHATVALGGDGGDELFGGYRHYGWIERHAAWRRRLPETVRRGLAATAARMLPLGTRGRGFLLAGARDGSWSIANTAVQFDRVSRTRLLCANLRERTTAATVPETWRGTLGGKTGSLLQQATRADFQSYLPDDVLVKVDRASMATSLEVRAPWLDPRIVEFAYGAVPDSMRSRGGGLKILPRRLAAKLLPKELGVARKRGFSVPLAAWFRGSFGRFVREILADADPELFEPAYLRRLVSDQRRGFVNEDRLFALVMFELWRRRWAVTL
jgi:asparagine synthase (glutamine-hydrolysing)